MFHASPKLPDSYVVKHKIGELISKLFGICSQLITVSLELICITEWFDEPSFLELNPEYQREVVWFRKLSRSNLHAVVNIYLLDKAMSGLINSLFENYYIPPVIFNLERVTLPNGSKRDKRICVDGKQRLSSIKAFVQGEIPCRDKHGRPWWYCKPSPNQPTSHKLRRSILPEEVKHEFRNKFIVCHEFRELQPNQEEDLFARVQLGVQLTPAEKLRGTSGPWQDHAKLFERDFNDVVNLAVNSHASGFQNILTAFVQIIEVMHPSNANGVSQCKVKVVRIQSFVRNTQTFKDPIKSHLSRVFTIFQNILTEDPGTFGNNNYQRSHNFTPIEIIGVSVLISKYCDTRNQKTLTEDIKAFREFVRIHNKHELRKDDPTWKTMWRFIDELPIHRGTEEGSSEQQHSTRMSSISSDNSHQIWDNPARSSRTSTSAQPEASQDTVRARSASVDSVLGQAREQ